MYRFNELLTLKEQEQGISSSSSSSVNDSITNIDFDAENSNLLYKEEYNFKRREDDINEGSSESYILPIETSVPTSMSKLLPEFDQQIITISNIPPYIDRAILEGHINEPISKLDLTAPNADKGYYRLGWLKLEDNSSEKVTEFITKLESLGSIEGAKLYFGVASSGFRRFRVTCYPTGDKEEEEQKSLALQLISVLESKSAEPESEFNNFGLDQLIFYLRKKHNFCFYCCQKFTSSQELLFKCGDLHLRRGIDVATFSSSSASENVKRDFKRLIDKIRSTLNFVKVLTQQHEEKEVNEEEDETRINEILSETSISKIEEGKYRCIHCLKAFKGPEFVLKHLHLKHEDILLRTKEELADFSKLLRNAPMWLFPTSMLPRHSRPKSHGKEPSSGRKASTSSSSSSKRNQSSTSNYVDWDASKSSSMEISYDLEY